MMLERIQKIIPKYAYIPLIMCVVFNILVFFGTRPFTDSLKHYNFSIWIDHALPFVNWMIIIYVLAYVHWIVGYIWVARENKELCYYICAADLVAKFLCLICFIVIPTEMVRPEINGNGFCNWLCNVIYLSDSPNNLFPSIHCLESWIVFRGALKCSKGGNVYRIIMFIGALLVFASTLLVKQHLFVDVFGGIASVEIGLFLSGKFNLAKVFYSLESKLKHEGK